MAAIHACLPANLKKYLQPAVDFPLEKIMSDKIYNILFLCTGNSARSIMAEALVHTMGKNAFRAYSAGSQPTGRVNPFAIEQVAFVSYPIDGLRSKSWDEFALPEAPQMDFIITVCDNAAGEVCPIWPGQPISAHWGFEDPAAVEGSAEEKRRAFANTFQDIMKRVQVLVNLPLTMLDKNALKREIKIIGDTPV